LTINFRVLYRKLHRWGAIIVALPFLLVLVTGIVLQLKKEIAWIQPPTLRGSSNVPQIGMGAILDAAKTVEAAQIQDWKDIDRIDVQPSRGIAKVQAKNRYEIQIDLANGAVLQTAYRRSDLFETLHDGSWFHEGAKLWIFLPSGIIVLGLWMTGIYLFVLPHQVRWSRGRKTEKQNENNDLENAKT
jgi:uncharacterized iron-regulated membrane protein